MYGLSIKRELDISTQVDNTVALERCSEWCAPSLSLSGVSQSKSFSHMAGLQVYTVANEHRAQGDSIGEMHSEKDLIRGANE